MSARDLAATARAWATADPHTNTSPDDLLIALANALDALEQQAADAQAKYDRDMDEAVEAIRRHYLARVRAEETLAYVRAELQNALDAFNASCRETDKFEARAVAICGANGPFGDPWQPESSNPRDWPKAAAGADT